VAFPRALTLVVGLFLAGALSSCTSFVTGMGRPANASLQNALQAGVDGFAPSSAPAPPRFICAPVSDPVPPVAPGLRDPASAAYTQDDAELDAWAWHASSSGAAADLVDQAVADAGACENELYADSDTNGDGQLDSGSSTVTTAERYDRSGWEGIAVRTEHDGRATVETRYVRKDDVIVLVALLKGGDDAAQTVDDYLEAVAGAL
jgi:hypothetical protein